ncbi:MAG: hypothetical protein RLZZ450_5696, partial [Pseudomonadota bacterium]
MERWVRVWLASVSLLVAASVLPALTSVARAQQPGVTVTVKIAGFKGVEGLALVTLYDSEQSWLKVPKAIQVVRAKISGSA